MKTKPAQPNPEPATVNFVSHNRLLTEKVGSFFARSRTAAVVVSDCPLSEDGLDAYVVPADEVTALLAGTQRPATWLPVIAYGERAALLEAFAYGCRDYLKEPWDMTELDVRLSAVLRVREPDREMSLAGDRLKTTRGELLLKPNEARILRTLLKARGQAVSREVLYYAIWGKIKNPESRVVDVHVSALRRKLSGLTGLTITQVRGEGYRLA